MRITVTLDGSRVKGAVKAIGAASAFAIKCSPVRVKVEKQAKPALESDLMDEKALVPAS